MRKKLLLFLVFIIIFTPVISVYADSVSHSGSFINGWGPYLSVKDFDITNSYHVSSSASVTFKPTNGTDGKGAIYRFSTLVAFYDSDYNELASFPMNSLSGNMYKTAYSRTVTYNNDFASDSFEGFERTAYVRFYANWTVNNSVTGTCTSSYSCSVDGRERTVIDAVDDQTEVIKEQHQEEIDKAEEASGSITSGADQLTGTLSSWEIFTMPFKLMQDLIAALSSDGSTGITFPSFSIMDHQLWPSYTFDLAVIADKFPVLYNSLHLISGILIISAFVHYCWRKWSIITGDDLPEG